MIKVWVTRRYDTVYIWEYGPPVWNSKTKCWDINSITTPRCDYEPYAMDLEIFTEATGIVPDEESYLEINFKLEITGIVRRSIL
jgi:hypothetical protein